MAVSKETIKLIVGRARASLKVREQIKVTRNEAGNVVKEQSVVEEVITNIFDFIERINQLPEFTYSWGGRPLEQIIIANEWADFIQPESVRYDPTDIKTANLIVRPVTNASPLTAEEYADWLDLQIRFRGFFKKDLSSDITDLQKLRAPKSLFDVLPIAQFNRGEEMFVRSLDKPFIPIELNSSLMILFNNNYFNTTAREVINDYTNEIRF